MQHAAVACTPQRFALGSHRGLVGDVRAGGPMRHAGVLLRRPSVATNAFVELHDAVANVASSLDGAHLHASLLATLAVDPVTLAASAGVTPGAVDAAATAAGTAASNTGSGPFDALAHGFESFLTVLDELLEKLGVRYSYGWAIIVLTVLVKLATFPLSQKQVQSTQALQALQPQVKELQTKYAGDQETIQLETARLYREAGVNPLAGCLPTLATIPVFIGLYRALTMAADDGLLMEGWYWIPSLSGPTSMASRTAGAGFSWLFPFVDGHPPIGWTNALAYLVMPVLLIVSQFVSQKVMSPPTSNDPQAQQTNAILKFLPLLIGYFSLNVPSGLTLYWFTNNILSTAQQLYLKSNTKVTVPSLDASSATIDTTATTVVKPKEERVKKIAGKEVGARRRKDDSIDGTESSGEAPSPSPSPSAQQQPQPTKAPQPQSRGSKGAKFAALKAKEAAGKASAQSNGSGNSAGTSMESVQSSTGSMTE